MSSSRFGSKQTTSVRFHRFSLVFYSVPNVHTSREVHEVADLSRRGSRLSRKVKSPWVVYVMDSLHLPHTIIMAYQDRDQTSRIRTQDHHGIPQRGVTTEDHNVGPQQGITTEGRSGASQQGIKTGADNRGSQRRIKAGDNSGDHKITTGDHNRGSWGDITRGNQSERVEMGYKTRNVEYHKSTPNTRYFWDLRNRLRYFVSIIQGINKPTRQIHEITTCDQ